MAKSRAYRWNGWRTDLKGGTIKGDPTKPKRKRAKKERGITNAQARYLARLQRELGVPYSGAGMTMSEAHAAIRAAIAEVDRRAQGMR